MVPSCSQLYYAYGPAIHFCHFAPDTEGQRNNELETPSSLFYIPSSFSLLSFSLFIVFSKEISLEFVSIMQLGSSQE